MGITFWYWNGSAWATGDFAQVGSGVTSRAGTANQISVSASAGAVTLSLPQNLHSGASPTFGGINLTDNAVLANNTSVQWKDTAGTAIDVLKGPTDNTVRI